MKIKALPDSGPRLQVKTLLVLKLKVEVKFFMIFMKYDINQSKTGKR
jgi:hypothetical protein